MDRENNPYRALAEQLSDKHPLLGEPIHIEFDVPVVELLAFMLACKYDFPPGPGKDAAAGVLSRIGNSWSSDDDALLCEAYTVLQAELSSEGPADE